jgi:hypothetical protein
MTEATESVAVHRGADREVATLAFDSANASFQGSRSAVLTDARRQFVWTSSEFDLAITMWSDAYAVHAVCVDGQVLPRAQSNVACTVFLMIEGVEVGCTIADSDGCFAFEGLDHGDYEFRIESPLSTVLAGPIPVL